MSFSREFLQLTRDMSGKDLSQRVASSGGNKYLGEGAHDVKVIALDRNQLAQNKITVKYADAKGLEHNDKLFVTDTNKKTGVPELNWKFAGLLGMLIPSTEAYDAFMAEVHANNPEVLDWLVGLGGKLTIARGKGFSPAKVEADGTYVVTNTQNPLEYYVGTTVEEAQEAATKAGLNKAYLNTVNYQATSGDENIAKFTAKLAAFHSAVKPQGFKPKLAVGI